MINLDLPNLPISAIAGILTACGYAIRESVSVSDAIEELGFEEIVIVDYLRIRDIQRITGLANFCINHISVHAEDDELPGVEDFT